MLKTLLIENKPDDALNLIGLLNKATVSNEYTNKFDITWVKSLTEGKKTLIEYSFDLVITEIDLPDSNLEKLNELIELEVETAFIILTSCADEVIWQKCLHIGAEEYLKKDQIHSIDFLYKLIIHAVERHKTNLQLKETIGQLYQHTLMLNKSNDELSNLAADTSHDLKEPLRTISEFSKLVADEYGENLDDTGKDYIKRIVSACDRMNLMFKEMLSPKEIFTTSDNQNTNKINLNTVIIEVLSDLEIKINETEANIRLEDVYNKKNYLLADSGELRSQLLLNTVSFFNVNMSTVSLRRILINLISNAIKYVKADSKPEVTIVFEKFPNCISIAIEDNGIGFNMEDKDLIFDRDIRLVANDSTYHGTGLGLSTVKNILDRHDCEIRVHSEPDIGSSFRLFIPLKNKKKLEVKSKI